MEKTAQFFVKTRLSLKLWWRLSAEKRQWAFISYCEEFHRVGCRIASFTELLKCSWACSTPSVSNELSRCILDCGSFGQSNNRRWKWFNRISFRLMESTGSPMKILTVPKLELHVALLAARLSEEIMQAFTRSVEKNFLCTDNKTVLQFPKSSEKQPIFLHNCVSECSKLKTVNQWYYKATFENPADSTTQRLLADALINISLFRGSGFRRKPDTPSEVGSSVLSSVQLMKVK